MSEHESVPDLPEARVLWGRVATAVVVVLVAFGMGRCSADGVPEDEVAALDDQVASLQSENEQLRAQVDSLGEALDEQSDPAPTEGATPEPTSTASDVRVEGAPGGIWTVESGDTLFEIALDVYDDPDQRQAIAQANGLTLDSTLTVGQVLQLPPAP